MRELGTALADAFETIGSVVLWPYYAVKQWRCGRTKHLPTLFVSPTGRTTTYCGVCFKVLKDD